MGSVSMLQVATVRGRRGLLLAERAMAEARRDEKIMRAILDGWDLLVERSLCILCWVNGIPGG